MVSFKLKNGGTVSLDDVDEIEVTVPYETASLEVLVDKMYRFLMLSMQIAGSFPIATAYDDVINNRKILNLMRDVEEGRRERSIIFALGDGYEQDT